MSDISTAIEALKPFADVADEYHDSEDDHLEVWMDAGPQRLIRASFELGMYRKAREAYRALTTRLAPDRTERAREDLRRAWENDVCDAVCDAENGKVVGNFTALWIKSRVAALTPATAPDREAIVAAINEHCEAEYEGFHIYGIDSAADAILKLIKGEG